jgi:hypothetical protein
LNYFIVVVLGCLLLPCRLLLYNKSTEYIYYVRPYSVYIVYHYYYYYYNISGKREGRKERKKERKTKRSTTTSSATMNAPITSSSASRTSSSASYSTSAQPSPSTSFPAPAPVAAANTPSTDAFLKDFTLVAEAAKRAQVAVMVRDFENCAL